MHYIWGVAPEFVYRFANHNELVMAPRNTFGGPAEPSAFPRRNPGGYQMVVFIGLAGPLRTPLIGPPKPL